MVLLAVKLHQDTLRAACLFFPMPEASLLCSSLLLCVFFVSLYGGGKQTVPDLCELWFFPSPLHMGVKPALWISVVSSQHSPFCYLDWFPGPWLSSLYCGLET